MTYQLKQLLYVICLLDMKIHIDLDETNEKY